MTCPTCAAHMHTVQYVLTAQDYDGVSEYACPQCALRIGRWSGPTLEEGELEARYGVDSPYKVGVKSTPVRAFAKAKVEGWNPKREFPKEFEEDDDGS